MTEPHFHGQAGVRIAGTGLGLPEGRLTNADLEKIMDTSDEWIVQRTGIRERRKADPDHESQVSMATKALDAALSDAGMKGSDLDLVINGTCSPDSTVPSGACRVAANVGDHHLLADPIYSSSGCYRVPLPFAFGGTLFGGALRSMGQYAPRPGARIDIVGPVRARGPAWFVQ